MIRRGVAEVDLCGPIRTEHDADKYDSGVARGCGIHAA